jgi:hypothetical protein
MTMQQEPITIAALRRPTAASAHLWRYLNAASVEQLRGQAASEL